MSVKKHIIVSLGRQLGSNGYFVGKMIASALGLFFYDKELLYCAAKESGLCPEIFENSDEKVVSSWSKLLNSSDFFGGSFFDPQNASLSRESIFSIQSGVIRKIVNEHPCLIVGRCADYVLRDNPDMRSIFIHAPLETRIANVAERMNTTAEEAATFIAKEEKKRAAYYNYFTDKTWGACGSYHFSLDTGLLGVDQCAKSAVELIKQSYL